MNAAAFLHNHLHYELLIIDKSSQASEKLDRDVQTAQQSSIR